MTISTADTDNIPMPSDGATEAKSDYLSRRLRYVAADGEEHQVDEAGLIAIIGSKVVLGEPGIGKSELIEELGRQLGLKPISAVRFMASKNPARFVVPGKPLLIDGLDEAIARRDGDAVDLILAQIEEAEPDAFILSCREREWQERTVTSMRQVTGADPTILRIEPFDRTETLAFLASRYPAVDADGLLDHLVRHQLTELAQNPLTLGFMGRVAEHDPDLPENRAGLFERVFEIVWPEHDGDRQDSGLAQLTRDQAFDAAGAISAALMLSGAEAASLAGQGFAADTDLRLAEIETLPSAGQARAIFSSKLFKSDGPQRAKPVHRVIAEFLGARWLARCARTPKAQRRLLAQFSAAGGVPASLRGLHAWLAYHAPALADRVISADPYGVLRAGEMSGLTDTQAGWMVDALEKLASQDPYFRPSDWYRHSAAGLMKAALAERIAGIIADDEANPQLRSLFLEAVAGSPIALVLGPTLEAILFNAGRGYSDRREAASALREQKDHDWWRDAIAKLGAEATVAATQLQRFIIEMIDGDVGDDVLVTVLCAELGLIFCPLPRIRKARRHTLRSSSVVLKQLRSERLVAVLDRFAEHSALVAPDQYDTWADLCAIVEPLFVRALDEERVGPADAVRLYHWFAIVGQARRVPSEAGQALRERLDTDDALRRAIQAHAYGPGRGTYSLGQIEARMDRRLVSTRGRQGDVALLLDAMADLDNRTKAHRDDWRALMRLGHSETGWDPALLAASALFQKGDAKLAAFVARLDIKKKARWEIKDERRREKARRKRLRRHGEDRQFYAARRADLVAATPAIIAGPAGRYLGGSTGSEKALSAQERVSQWLGEDLLPDVMLGLEAALHRSDLPTPREVAEDFVASRTWSISYAIMAGLLARQRAGTPLDTVPRDTLWIGLLLCYNESHWTQDADFDALETALETIVLATAQDREDLARLWVEPFLKAKREYIPGLYKLTHHDGWQETAAALAPPWLLAFPDLPDETEFDLVESAARGGAVAALVPIAAARSLSVYRNFDHMMGWIAVDLLVRFDDVVDDLAGIGRDHPELIWRLRDLIQLERRGSLIPVSVALARWIIDGFRESWPHSVLEGSGSGDRNSYDATDFLMALVGRLANDTGLDAVEALETIAGAPADSYTEILRHMLSEQRQKAVEETTTALAPAALRDLLDDGPPSNIDDLKTLVLEELDVAQAILKGDDLDQIRDFWGDNGIPYDENRGRDRLATLIGPALAIYDVQRITEADMPNTKRADLAFMKGRMQLPMEIKGQWHSEVWDAATGQLEARYLIDWRSEQRGIYCVLWFGDLPSATGRRLKAPPAGVAYPASAAEMRARLIERIPESRRARISVVVLDLTRRST